MGANQNQLEKLHAELMELYRSNQLVMVNEKVQELLAAAREAQNHYYYAICLNFLGAYQTAIGNLSRAVDYYFDAMVYGEKYHVNDVLALVYNNIAARYMDAFDYESALIYLKKANDISMELKDGNGKASSSLQCQRLIIYRINLAWTYTNLKQYEQSNYYLNLADTFLKEEPDADLEFTSAFLHCRNQYFLGDFEYVKANLEGLLRQVEKLASLYNYEQNITEMFDFLVELKEKEKVERLMRAVESFEKEHQTPEFRMIACKMRGTYEKNYGTEDGYRKCCVERVLLYEEQEEQSRQDRKEYMNLRMKMKAAEREYNEAEEKQKELLTKALIEAKRANAAKTEFLSRMSHEIRTPLNAIIGYTAMAQNNLDNLDKVQDYHAKSQIAAKHLLSLINDVLDISSITSGHFKMELAPFDISQIVFDIKSIFREQALQKKISFEIRLEHIKEEILIGDSLRVKQILLNLISNAMKFTMEGGSIAVCVEQTRMEQTNHVQMKFMVQDDGIGMKKEFLDRIFVPFEQQDASISRKYGGTGLGLSISEQLTEMMNGRIDVESSEGKGTTFIVTIPFTVGEKPGLLKPEKTEFPERSVLIVDSDSRHGNDIKHLFRSLKMKPLVISDADRILELLTVQKEEIREYEVCLIGDVPKELDVMKLAQRIRQAAGEKLFLLLSKDYITAQFRREAQAAGVDQVVENPLFLSKLRELLLERFEGKKAYKQKAGKTFNFAGLRVLIAEDNEMNMEIAEDILMRANLKVTKAMDGRAVCKTFLDAAPGTFQVILMDIQMPEMDGYEAARTIRASGHPDAERIPILALTANAFHEDKLRSAQAGMNGHVAKPINVKELYQELSRVLAGE